MEKNENRVVLLIEDDRIFEGILTKALAANGISNVVALKSYTEALRHITRNDMTLVTCAIIDIRLRKQVFDQGGLTLADMLKQKVPHMPIVLLTAYSEDYPGINKVVQRYTRTMVYEKNVFLSSISTIMEQLLLNELPPQLGEEEESAVDSNSQRVISPSMKSGHTAPTHTSESGYQPATWEKISVFAVVILIVGAILYAALQPQELPARNFVLLRILVSLAVAVLGAIVPGFLHVGLNWRGVAIRAGGALALFVVTFFFSPGVIPADKSIDRQQQKDRP